MAVDIGVTAAVIVNGQSACFTSLAVNNPLNLTDACDITDTTVVLVCPDATGASNGQVITLGSDLDFPPNSASLIDFGATCCDPIVFNDGVTEVKGRIQAGMTGDLTKGRFHQTVADLTFQIEKEAAIQVLSCEAQIDKQVMCEGAPFVDEQFTTNDADGAEACTSWNAHDGMDAEDITVRYVVRNTGTAALFNCTITESNGAITTGASQTNPIPIPTVDPGTDSTPIDLVNACSDELDAGEPDRADLACNCALAPDDPNPVPLTPPIFDRADFECLTPGLMVDKVCEAVGSPDPSPFTITVMNTGTAALANCTITDNFSPGDEFCGALQPGPAIDPIPSLPAGQSVTRTGTLNLPPGDSCNRAEVTCEIVDSVGPKTISDTDDAICTVTSTTTTTTTTTTTSSTSTTTTTTTSTTTTTNTTLCPPVVLLVNEHGRLGNASSLFGGFGANDPAVGFIQLGRRAFTSDGTLLIANTVKILPDGDIFKILANNKILGAGTVVRMPTNDPPVLPIQDPFCPIPAIGDECVNQPPINITRLGSLTLTPGVYGNVRMMNHATLTLQGPGTFTFCSILAARLSEVRAAGGQVTINIRGNLRIANSGFLGPDSGAPLPIVNVQGLAVRVGAGAFIQAFLSAPNAGLRIGRSGKLAGVFCVDTVGSDKGVTLECPPITQSPSGAFIDPTE